MSNQLELFDRKTAVHVVESEDYSDLRVLIGLSGGINSMALLCMLAALPDEKKPAELHLFYSHIVEHSPDTEVFVHAGVEYAKRHFGNVHYEQINYSVLDFFRSIRLIPHPTRAFCTEKLKIEPMYSYMVEHQIQLDLVGYVREEKKRADTMYSKDPNLAYYKGFPILNLSNDDCFAIVEQEIGWYPAIYKILDEKGKRLFSHNNCLPYKNMHIAQLRHVEKYYPDYFAKAVELSNELNAYWGRDADKFYTEFGIERDELGHDSNPCEVCAFS
ncbi:hypothetical protein [Spirosoma oryzicola]|uniref:hypothetical protein n=1 Tax=Spirosoma oryzicola TaxID=2898794 RepID=UPI001E40DEFE|nr:hypothetical protein [Spirosoma oryzicola]UHG93291.1 hypothetical protein LQ777_10400 [Spirosoma oryzicola]